MKYLFNNFKLMKYSILLFVGLLAISCGKDESSSDEQLISLVSPPDWIIGSWDSEETNLGSIRYVFTENNVEEQVIQNGQVASTIDYNEYYNKENITLTEDITSDRYSIVVEVTTQLNGEEPYTQSLEKIFIRLSDTQIEYTNYYDISLGVIFTKQ